MAFLDGLSDALTSADWGSSMRAPYTSVIRYFGRPILPPKVSAEDALLTVGNQRRERERDREGARQPKTAAP